MKITIIGAGNAGCAHAFKLSEFGHSINLLKTSNSLHDNNFEEIKKNGGIWGIDNTNEGRKSFQKINLITRNIDVALKDADIIMVLTQSIQHQRISSLIIDKISIKTKLLLIIPGNLGSLYFRKNITRTDLIISEGESTPFDARIVKKGVVNILFKNVRNATSFLPSKDSDLGLAILNELYPTYGFVRSNIIETALHNPNLIVHTIGVIMSASRIEYSKGEFWMYREAFTESIWRLIKILDKEKNKIIEKFNGVPSAYIDECKFRNETDLTRSSMDVFHDYAKNGGPKGPVSLETRYLFEDVSLGLCTLSKLGKIAMIKTPLCDSLINIASALLEYNFWESSVDFDQLEWTNKSTDEIINYLEKGEF